jgi:hypothetical protein
MRDAIPTVAKLDTEIQRDCWSDKRILVRVYGFALPMVPIINTTLLDFGDNNGYSWWSWLSK